MQFVDDRRAGGAVLRDEDVDLVTVERGSLQRLAGLAFAAVASRREHRHVLDQVGADRVDMLGDARDVGESGRDLLDQMVDRELGGLAIERAHIVAPLLVPLRDLADDVFEVALQRLDVGLRLLAFGLRPGVEFVRRHDLAVLRGGQRESDGRAQQQDRLFARLFAQGGKRLELLLLKRFVDGAAPRLIVFALEGGGRRDLEVFDQLVHRLLEAGRAPRREFDGDRPVRFGEIVDVDPVGGAGPRSRVLRQHGLDRLLHADAGRADDEEVEALSCRSSRRSRPPRARAPARSSRRSAPGPRSRRSRAAKDRRRDTIVRRARLERPSRRQRAGRSRPSPPCSRQRSPELSARP